MMGVGEAFPTGRGEATERTVVPAYSRCSQPPLFKDWCIFKGQELCWVLEVWHQYNPCLPGIYFLTEETGNKLILPTLLVKQMGKGYEKTITEEEN